MADNVSSTLFDVGRQEGDGSRMDSARQLISGAPEETGIVPYNRILQAFKTGIEGPPKQACERPLQLVLFPLCKLSTLHKESLPCHCTLGEVR